MGEVTGGDVEVWPDLKLPANADALLGVTVLEKLGFRVDPRTGKLEKSSYTFSDLLVIYGEVSR